MSALPQALPLALSAAFYPPALLVLLLLMSGKRPRRLVLAYFAIPMESMNRWEQSRLHTAPVDFASR